jgi:hypothetical protein
MNAVKYIGMDVHLAMISIAVLDAKGKLMMESTIATRAGDLLDLIRGLETGDRRFTGFQGEADTGDALVAGDSQQFTVYSKNRWRERIKKALTVDCQLSEKTAP